MPLSTLNFMTWPGIKMKIFKVVAFPQPAYNKASGGLKVRF
jgi:hypothetical protein